MKTFAPFLLVPAMGLAGWQLSRLHEQPPEPKLPSVAPLDAPPALGVTAPYPKDRAPVRVSMEALLPIQELQRPAPPPPPPQPPTAPPPPTVTAILIHGELRVAQVAGMAMAVGEGVGGYRITAIEAERVLFENTSLGQLRWVSMTTP